MTVQEDLRDGARSIFAGDDADHKACDDCGGVHARACPRIASLHVIIGTEGDVKGVIIERHVTYWPPGQWEKDVIFWDDINDGT